MKIPVLVLGGLLMAQPLLTACEDKNELSRNKAERMITEKFKFPLTDTIRVSGMNEIDEYSVERYRYLEKKGLVKLTSRTATKYGMNQTVYAATLTDEGKKHLLAEKKDQVSGTLWLFPGHRTELQEITGIQFNEMGVKMAKVDFKVITKDFTPFDVFDSGGDEQRITAREGKSRERDVVFQLYDDGWRIR